MEKTEIASQPYDSGRSLQLDPLLPPFQFSFRKREEKKREEQVQYLYINTDDSCECPFLQPTFFYGFNKVRVLRASSDESTDLKWYEFGFFFTWHHFYFSTTLLSSFSLREFRDSI